MTPQLRARREHFSQPHAEHQEQGLVPLASAAARQSSPRMPGIAGKTLPINESWSGNATHGGASALPGSVGSFGARRSLWGTSSGSMAVAGDGKRSARPQAA